MLSLLILLLVTLLLPWNFGTQANFYSRILLCPLTRVTCQIGSSLICYQHWAWREHRKHRLLYCCVLGRVYRAVAWQRVDQIRYNMYKEALRLYTCYRRVYVMQFPCRSSCRVLIQVTYQCAICVI
jgi:hypothetical protein